MLTPSRTPENVHWVYRGSVEMCTLAKRRHPRQYFCRVYGGHVIGERCKEYNTNARKEDLPLQGLNAVLGKKLQR